MDNPHSTEKEMRYLTGLSLRGWCNQPLTKDGKIKALMSYIYHADTRRWDYSVDKAAVTNHAKRLLAEIDV